MLIQIKLFVITTLIAVVFAQGGQDWSGFKSKFAISFSSIGEEQYRQVVYAQNLNAINAHNQKAANDKSILFKMGPNRFTHLTHEEFLAKHTGLKRIPRITKRFVHEPMDDSPREKRQVATTSKPCSCTCGTTAKQTTARQTTTRRTTTAVSKNSTVDWRGSFMVGPVKYQGNCGSCWAFSAISALEGQLAKKLGKFSSLSEQHLVDCNLKSKGCDGGDPMTAFDYILGTSTKGLNTNAVYPYTSGDSGSEGSCKFRSSSLAGILSSYLIDQSIYPKDNYYGSNPKGNETWLAEQVATNGPVAVCLHVSSYFKDYMSGIYSEVACSSTLIPKVNHCVNIVGYGTDLVSGKEYWIMRNSWDTTWGEGGYMRLRKNYGNQLCVASEMYMPVVSTVSG